MDRAFGVICLMILLTVAGGWVMIASVDNDTILLEGVVVDKYYGWGTDYLIVEDADGVRYEIYTRDLVRKYQKGDEFSEELSTWKVTEL